MNLLDKLWKNASQKNAVDKSPHEGKATEWI